MEQKEQIELTENTEQTEETEQEIPAEQSEGKKKKERKKIPLLNAILIVLFACVITFQGTFLYLNRKYKEQINELKSSSDSQLLAKLSAIDEIYDNYYIGEDVDEETLEKYTIYGYLTGTGDKYTQYMTAEEYEEFTQEMAGNSVGIGVMVSYDTDTGYMTVISVVPDSPAEKAGVKSGDVIIEVDGQDVSEIGYYAAVELVKGDEGTEVNFGVLRDEEFIAMKATRAAVTTQSVIYHMFENESDHVGIVKLLQFDDTTPTQFAEAVNSLIEQGATSFVFDVRDNPGGELNSVCDVLDMLVPEGDIIRIFDADGNVSTLKSDANEFDAPMVVLVNENTASAAELFSACLRDYEKAQLVGVQTYGKGCMQTILQLTDGSAVRVTYRMYSSPLTDNYDGVGLTPDVIIEESELTASINPYLISDTDDNQLLEAVKVLKAQNTDN